MTTSIQTLGIPCYNRGDLLLRCIQSVDHPVENLFLIDNGNDPEVAAVMTRVYEGRVPNARFFRNVTMEKHKNLGCGPSWNHIMESSPGWWLFTGSDVEFKPGSLKKVFERAAEDLSVSIVCAHGYNVFAVSPLGRKGVGLFDENFYPAYFEDIDHFRRVALSGSKAVDVPGFAHVHGEAPHWGSSTIKSDPLLDAKNRIVMENLGAYYLKKWGGPPGKEKFRTPFDRNVPLDFWEADPELRRLNSLW